MERRAGGEEDIPLLWQKLFLGVSGRRPDLLMLGKLRRMSAQEGELDCRECGGAVRVDCFSAEDIVRRENGWFLKSEGEM